MEFSPRVCICVRASFLAPLLEEPLVAASGIGGLDKGEQTARHEQPEHTAL